jgi:hypothetical protein
MLAVVALELNVALRRNRRLLPKFIMVTETSDLPRIILTVRCNSIPWKDQKGIDHAFDYGGSYYHSGHRYSGCSPLEAFRSDCREWSFRWFRRSFLRLQPPLDQAADGHSPRRLIFLFCAPLVDGLEKFLSYPHHEEAILDPAGRSSHFQYSLYENVITKIASKLLVVDPSKTLRPWFSVSPKGGQTRGWEVIWRHAKVLGVKFAQ